MTSDLTSLPTSDLRNLYARVYDRWANANFLANYHPTRYMESEQALRTRLRSIENEIQRREDGQ